MNEFRKSSSNTYSAKSIRFSGITVLFVSLMLNGTLQAQLKLDARIETRLEGRFQLKPLFTQDGETIIVADNGSLAIWNARNGKMISKLCTWRSECIRSLALSPNGNTVCSAGKLNSWKLGNKQFKEGWQLHFWDVPTMKHLPECTLIPEPKGDIGSLQYSKDGSMFAYIAGTTVCVHDAKSRSLITTIECTLFPNCIDFDNESKHIAIACSKGDRDGLVTVLNIKSGEVKNIALPWKVLSVAFQPKSNRLFTGAGFLDRKIRVWDVTSGKEIDSISISNGYKDQWQIAFNQDGTCFTVEGELNGKDHILVYSCKTKACIGSISEDIVKLSWPAFSVSTSDGRIAVHGEESVRKVPVIQLWSFRSAKHDPDMSASQLDQLDMVRDLVYGDAIDADYLHVFAPAKHSAWKKDADSGCKYGTFLLGMSFLHGAHGIKNVNRGIELIEHAAANGNSLALICLATRETTNHKKAFEYYSRAADKDFLLGYEYLASCYRNCLGVDKNDTKAFELSLLAASHSKPISSSMISVGVSYRDGTGVTKNAAKAVEWFKASIANNHPDGYHYLGMCYLAGTGVEMDARKALELFELGARRGNTMAMMDLAYCYESGSGCVKNYEAALSLYSILSARGVKDAIKRSSALKQLFRQEQEKAEQDAKTKSEIASYLFQYQNPQSHSRTAYEAHQAAWEAQRDYMNHVSGRLGAMGLTPVLIAPQSFRR